MATQIFDDGTSYTTDAAGSIISVTDNTGATVPVASDLMAGFQASILGAFNSLLRQVTAPASSVTPANAQVSAGHGFLSLLPLAAIGVGAYLLLKS